MRRATRLLLLALACAAAALPAALAQAGDEFCADAAEPGTAEAGGWEMLGDAPELPEEVLNATLAALAAAYTPFAFSSDLADSLPPDEMWPPGCEGDALSVELDGCRQVPEDGAAGERYQLRLALNCSHTGHWDSALVEATAEEGADGAWTANITSADFALDDSHLTVSGWRSVSAAVASAVAVWMAVICLHSSLFAPRNMLLLLPPLPRPQTPCKDVLCALCEQGKDKCDMCVDGAYQDAETGASARLCVAADAWLAWVGVCLQGVLTSASLSRLSLQASATCRCQRARRSPCQHPRRSQCPWTALRLPNQRQCPAHHQTTPLSRLGRPPSPRRLRCLTPQSPLLERAATAAPAHSATPTPGSACPATARAASTAGRARLATR